jgi:hypothetical protein
LRRWLGYPAGWWRLVLRSRFARRLPFVVTGAGYMYAAAPDFGFDTLTGWIGLGGLLFFWTASYYVTHTVTGAEIDSYRAAFKSIGEIISALAGAEDTQGERQLFREPHEAIDILLRRAQGLAVVSLHPPPGCEIAAHLLLPEWGMKRGKKQILGLRATRHDDFRPDRVHELIHLDAPGAGVAFSGVLAAVPDTDALDDPRVRGRVYKSIGAFPVVVGQGDARGRVRAVLALDATAAYVFTDETVLRLAPFINPIVQLIGLALATQERREQR